MRNSDLPYSVRMAVAMLVHDQKMADEVVVDCFDAMTKKFLAVAHEYDATDLPFVVATMRITATALSSILDENGRSFVEKLVSHTSCITVDAEELRKQEAEEREQRGDEKC